MKATLSGDPSAAGEELSFCYKQLDQPGQMTVLVELVVRRKISGHVQACYS